MLCRIFTSDLEVNMKSFLIQATVDAKISRRVNSDENRSSQSVLDHLV